MESPYSKRVLKPLTPEGVQQAIVHQSGELLSHLAAARYVLFQADIQSPSRHVPVEPLGLSRLSAQLSQALLLLREQTPPVSLGEYLVVQEARDLVRDLILLRQAEAKYAEASTPRNEFYH